MSLAARIALKKASVALKRGKLELNLLEKDPDPDPGEVASKKLELSCLQDELEIAELEFEDASNASAPSTPVTPSSCTSSSSTSSTSKRKAGRPRVEPVIYWCDFIGCPVSNLPDGTGRAAYSAAALGKHKESRNCTRNHIPCSNCGVPISTHSKEKHERSCMPKDKVKPKFKSAFTKADVEVQCLLCPVIIKGYPSYIDDLVQSHNNYMCRGSTNPETIASLKEEDDDVIYEDKALIRKELEQKLKDSWIDGSTEEYRNEIEMEIDDLYTSKCPGCKFKALTDSSLKRHMRDTCPGAVYERPLMCKDDQDFWKSQTSIDV